MILLHRLETDAALLWRDHPPRLHHPKKRAIFELAGGSERTPRSTIAVTRWAAPDVWPGLAPSSSVPAARSAGGPFDYRDPGPGVDAWHVNFADPELFAFYGGPAFAQDEIQVAEHPVLASVREALKEDPKLPPRTREAGRPTPVLVRGAERWCAIDTQPELARPHGIYGQRLARASEDALKQAVTRVGHAPTSNIIAMAAPQGHGGYAREEIADVLATAATAFAAARAESARYAPAARVRIATGHWGTGAFGGNRVLMAAAQLVAARIAEVEELEYHSLDDDGLLAFEKGRRIAERFPGGASFDAIVDTLDAMGFVWGRSDGN
jgi:Poly (ADP-ribose) glycohydrolase (PARG), Macro domain fold